MEFPSPLLPAVLVRRYKRFLANVAFPDGREETVHCPNPGAMLGVAPAGARVWVSKSPFKSRKLPLTLELVEVDGALVAINTANPNRIAAEAIAAGRVEPLGEYDLLRREVRYGQRSRVDLVLATAGRPPTYVEVKNVHLSREAGVAEFPDCVTARGARHLEELSVVRAEGARAVMLFIVQRMDCDQFRPAGDIDPNYQSALRAATAAGVETLCYDCEVTVQAVTLRRALPVAI